MAKIMVVVGHPQQNTLCEALAKSYVAGAERASHEVKTFFLGQMKFDPILHEGFRREQKLEPDLKAAYDAFVAADHIVFVFPLWAGDMPALLKGFIERLLQPDLIARQNTESAMNWNIFKNKSARIIMTMGMPVTVYRWFYRGHALKLLTRNILHFIGIKPVRHTLYGMVANSKLEQREQWITEMRKLGMQAA